MIDVEVGKGNATRLITNRSRKAELAEVVAEDVRGGI